MADLDAPPKTREGEVLAGKYVLEGRLGAGGMGEVYRAQNRLIGRTVAIKLLLPEHAKNAELVERFLREARAANLVRHPNVVDVLDIGSDEQGVPFIVQEFLEGEDFAHRLEEFGGRIPFDMALTIMIPVVEAVAAAHQASVVHRDLKPENVYLAREAGRVVPKVLDFGISRIAAKPGEHRMTATGVAMGTPAYMSPEQVQGARDVDARSDVWSLGVMLYEVLAGALPFDGETHGALFIAICTKDAIPLADVAPNVPRNFGNVVARCLRRNRAERYPNASELLKDLHEVREGLSIPPPRALPESALLLGPSSPRGAGAGRSDVATVAAGVPPPGAKASATAATIAAGSASAVTPSSPSGNVTPPADRSSAQRAQRGGIREIEAPRSAPPPAGFSKSRGRIDLARPARAPSVPSGFHEARGSIDAREIVQYLLAACLLAGAVALFVRNLDAQGIEVWSRISSVFAHSPAGVLALVAGGLGVAGVAMGARAFTSYPMSWGLVIAALGLLSLAYVFATSAVLGAWPLVGGGAQLQASAPKIATTGAVLVAAGLALFALGRAYDGWRSGSGSSRLLAAGAASLALGLAFVAMQIARTIGRPQALVGPSVHEGAYESTDLNDDGPGRRRRR